MIILNQKKLEAKYLAKDNVVIEINGSLTLEQIYEKLRKGEEISATEMNFKGYQTEGGEFITLLEKNGEPRPEKDKGYNFVFEDAHQMDAVFDTVKHEIPEIQVKYEKFLFRQDPAITFTEKEISKDLLRKEIAATLGIHPAYYDDNETSVADLRKKSLRSENLYWHFSEISKENRFPTKEDVELYESLSAYEKRIIGESFMHPMAVLDFIREVKKYGKDTKLTKEGEALLKAVHDRDHTMEKDVLLAANAYQASGLFYTGDVDNGFKTKKEADLTELFMLDEKLTLAGAKERATMLLANLSTTQLPFGDGPEVTFAQYCQAGQVVTADMINNYNHDRALGAAAAYQKLYENEFQSFLQKKKADQPTPELMNEFIKNWKPVPKVYDRIADAFKANLPRVPQIATEYVAMQALAMGKKIQDLSDFELETIVKKFDFKNVQIIRPFNNPAMYAFADKLDFKNMKKEQIEVFATYLKAGMIKPLLEKGFVEWFDKYKNMNTSELAALLSLNEDVDNYNRSTYYYVHDKISHFDPNMDPRALIQHVRLMKAAEDCHKYEQKYGIRFADKELAIRGRHTVAKQGDMIMEMMQPGDLRIFNAGRDTDCCQEYGNAGETCVTKIMMDPFATEVAIVKKGVVVAQGFVWTDEAKDTLVFDNVEFANYKNENFDNRTKFFTDIFAEWAKAMPYKNIHIGTGYLAGVMAGWGQQIRSEEFATIPSTTKALACYSDYHQNARTIKRDGNMLIHAKGAVQITTAPDEPTRWDLLRDNPAVSFLLMDNTQSAEDRIAFAQRFIENPTGELQMMAVQRNPQAIKGLDDPCVDVQVWIARNHPNLIQYITNPCDEIQDEMVRNDPKSIKNIQNPTQQMMIYAVEADRSLLKYLKDKNPSDEVFLAAVRKDGLAIIDVPEDRRTEEICKEAVNQKPIAISHIKDPVESVWQKAIDKDATIIKLIKNPTPEQQIYAVTKKPGVISMIYHPCREAIAEAVRRDGLLIRNYQMQYPYLRQTAIRQNPFIVTNGVLKGVSDEEYAMAVNANPAVLNLIRSRETRANIEEILRGNRRNDREEIADDFEER